MPNSSRCLWQRNGLYVAAELNEAGDLNISGQDLSGELWAEYEYSLTIRQHDVNTLVAALGGSSGDDVLDLLGANAETLITTGEKTWLEAHSVPAEFWSRIEPR